MFKNDDVYYEYIQRGKEMPKFRIFCDRFKQKAGDTKDWVMQNKEFVILVAPIVVGIGGKIIKFVIKQHTLHQEEELKDLYCYDRSLGHYWKLRRELTNQEWVEIDKRKRDGERLADILSDFKVLK